MQAPVWDEAYAIGIGEIDADHRLLIDTMNDAVVACMVGEDPATLKLFLGRVLQATRKHFSREEAIMATYGYADLDNHRALHRKLLAELEDIRDSQSEQLKPDESLALIKHLNSWLLDHIKQEDSRIKDVVG